MATPSLPEQYPCRCECNSEVYFMHILKVTQEVTKGCDLTSAMGKPWSRMQLLLRCLPAFLKLPEPALAPFGGRADAWAACKAACGCWGNAGEPQGTPWGTWGRLYWSSRRSRLGLRGAGSWAEAERPIVWPGGAGIADPSSGVAWDQGGADVDG